MSSFFLISVHLLSVSEVVGKCERPSEIVAGVEAIWERVKGIVCCWSRTASDIRLGAVEQDSVARKKVMLQEGRPIGCEVPEFTSEAGNLSGRSCVKCKIKP